MNYNMMKDRKKRKRKMKTRKKRNVKKGNLRDNVFASGFSSRLVCMKHLRGGNLHQILLEQKEIENIKM